MCRIEPRGMSIMQGLRIDDFERVLYRAADTEIDRGPFDRGVDIGDHDRAAGDLQVSEHPGSWNQFEPFVGEGPGAARLADRQQPIDIRDGHVVEAQTTLRRQYIR